MTVLNYRSAPPTSHEALEAKTVGNWLGWAVYLGTSWTWCIGMFLPVLMVRDYGLNGFYVFAIPNVLGAAAMGWVIREQALSSDITVSHRHACVAFSAVTIAFHLFVAAWLLPELTTPFHVPFATLALVSLFCAARAGGFWPIAAATFVFLTSVWLFAQGWFAGDFPKLRGPALRPTRELLCIAPVSALGFALSPYLDLTFHRARQNLSAVGARFAFSVGFGVIFTAMILFTLAYSGWFRQGMPVFVGLTIGCHILIQSAQTTALHANELVLRPKAGALLLALIVSLGLIMAWMIAGQPAEPSEDLYRFFMGFYALVFPAYVWLCMIGSPTRSPSLRAFGVFCAAVVVALPMFWLGFIEGRMIWLVPGLAVVLLARLAVPRPFKWTA